MTRIQSYSKLFCYPILLAPAVIDILRKHVGPVEINGSIPALKILVNKMIMIWFCNKITLYFFFYPSF